MPVPFLASTPAISSLPLDMF